MLKPQFHDFLECQVSTLTNHQATIPAGCHPTVHASDVTVSLGGRSIVMTQAEWMRLVVAGLVV